MKETRAFGGDLDGRGGGGGGADVQRQLDGVVRNKLIYQRIATALRVRLYVEAVCPEDEKPRAEIQKGYKARMIHIITAVYDTRYVNASGVVARGGRGGQLPPPAGLKNRGATEHKGRQQLKVCNN